MFHELVAEGMPEFVGAYYDRAGMQHMSEDRWDDYGVPLTQAQVDYIMDWATDPKFPGRVFPTWVQKQLEKGQIR